MDISGEAVGLKVKDDDMVGEKDGNGVGVPIFFYNYIIYKITVSDAGRLERQSILKRGICYYVFKLFDNKSLENNEIILMVAIVPEHVQSKLHTRWP